MGASQTALLLVQGPLEFDGRASRLVELAGEVFDLHILDAQSSCEAEGNSPGITRASRTRSSVNLNFQGAAFSRHVAFIKAALSEARRIQPQVVLAANFLTLLPGYLIARKLAVPFVYDAYELNAANEGPRSLIWHLLERLTLPHSHLVIAANESRAELMKKWFDLDDRVISLRNIPHSKPTLPRPQPENLTLKAFANTPTVQKFVLYQGDIDLGRGLLPFIEALDYLPPEFGMAIIGDGRGTVQIAQRANRHMRSGRLVLLGRVPYTELAALTCQAHVGIITYSRVGINNILCSPNKVFEYAQSRLPFVATDQPMLHEIVNKYGIGELVKATDYPREIALLLQKVTAGRPRYLVRIDDFLEENSFETDARPTLEALRRLLSSAEGRTMDYR